MTKVKFIEANPIRVSQTTTCRLLDITRQTLLEMIKRDSTFPKPIKMGESNQSSVYFDYQELLDWHESVKKKTRGLEAAQEQAND